MRNFTDYIDESQNDNSNETNFLVKNHGSERKSPRYYHVADILSSDSNESNKSCEFHRDISVDRNSINYNIDDINQSDNELRIERILACKSLVLEVWISLCKCMNTSEIESGSRWHQDQPANDDLSNIEKRYLVKWSDLSYMHCSWETKDDLFAETKGANIAFENFFHLKSTENDFYLDGYKLRQSFFIINRIIDVFPPIKKVTDRTASKYKYPKIILDKDHPSYDTGKGRKIKVAWSKHSVTNEYERDLFVHNIDYQVHLDKFLQKGKLNAKEEARTKMGLYSLGTEQLCTEKSSCPEISSKQSDDEKRCAIEYMTVEGIRRIKHYQDQAGGKLSIEKIVARQTLKQDDWSNICKSMNTNAIENGSRWCQDESHAQQDRSEHETRYLVKWLDLSYIHCSWETKIDLINEIKVAKTKIQTFDRKFKDRISFDLKDHSDRNYFDPSLAQIDRVLQILYPNYSANSGLTRSELKMEICNYTGKKWSIILDRDNPNYEFGMGRQILVKWKVLGYSKLSYEFERDLIVNGIDYISTLTSFLLRSRRPTEKMLKESFFFQRKALNKYEKLFGGLFDSIERKEKTARVFNKILESCVSRNGGQLKDYQAEGVTWLISNYVNSRSSILADEAGFGKTIQTVAYINTLSSLLKIDGPYLILAPVSTLSHWHRELSLWTDLNTVVYHGNSKERANIRQLEFAYESDRPYYLESKAGFLKYCHSKNSHHWQRPWMIQVVLTSPEMILADDFLELSTVQWKLVVIDEAHRLKNHCSKKNQVLKQSFPKDTCKLLLTDSPIQNNMKELWTLLNIVDPIRFDKSNDFLGKYRDLKNQQKIDKLNKDIRPYVLRRLKENVEHNVPPNEQTIVEVELTVLQKQCNRESYLKGVIAKDHLEKPLRNGAYDIFIENKAGSSQQESTNFITQDIDTILERRAKASIHDKIGNKRNLMRRSFSKASLKELSETSGSTDEVHLDNPDWKKIKVGKPAHEHNASIAKQLGNKRKKVDFNTDDYFDQLNNSVDIVHSAMKKKRGSDEETEFKLRQNNLQTTHRHSKFISKKQENEI